MRRSSPSIKAFVVAATVAAVSGPLSALANDFSVGGQGRDLYALAQEDVVMQSEVIELVQQSSDLSEWAVHATYVFATTAETAQAIRLGFPENACPDDGDTDCGDVRFHGMRTTVDGVELPNELGSLSTESHESELGRVWVYDIEVPAGGQVTVEHRYRYSPSQSGNAALIDYVTTTGALWPEPIGSADFRVWFAHPVNWTYYPESWGEPTVIRRVPDEVSGTPTPFAFEWHFDAWVPEENLDLMYGSEWFESSRCSSVSQVMYRLELGSDPVSEARHLVEAGLTSSGARICRNLMYAIHGYTFEDGELGSALEEGACWFPELEDRPCWRRTPSTDYTPQLLGYDEHRYIEVMQAVETLLGGTD